MKRLGFSFIKGFDDLSRRLPNCARAARHLRGAPAVSETDVLSTWPRPDRANPASRHATMLYHPNRRSSVAGNVCPKCGKAVMTYGRFFREAEPYRISPCGRCGARLRRSRAVYILLAVGCGACSATHTPERCTQRGRPRSGVRLACSAHCAGRW